jgi:predicted dithiol-disulfide oxidoreductase (DUF899 family)
MKAEPVEAKQMKEPRIVSENEWLAARKDFLTREKEFTRLRDELSARRRDLPWVKVEKNYVFEGTNGKEKLADLFEGRSQLLVYHFMLGPGWEEGCKSCSYLADHFDGPNEHLPHRDLTFIMISRAPFAQIEAFKKRMGWKIKWVSSHHNDFNFDYHVSATEKEKEADKMVYNFEVSEVLSDELPELSVFYRNQNGEIFHTYSTYARGLDMIVGAYHLLDLVPKGRDEDPDSPMSWVRHHDRY